MKNHIIFYSGGKASFAVADWVLQNHPDDNIVLYFTDTIWEDGDLYRFLREGADKMKLPMLIQSMDISPLQLMFERELVFSSRLGECSRILKQKVSKDYFFKDKIPKRHVWYNEKKLKSQKWREDATLYFGIGVEEAHRKDAIEFNWQPFEVKFPLMESYIDIDATLKKYNIDKPRLYILNFSHNNCGGRCIKGGQGHFLNLLQKDPQSFKELEEAEKVLNSLINETKPIKKQIKEQDDERLVEKLKAKHEKIREKYRSYFYEDDKSVLSKLFPKGQTYKYTFMKKSKNGKTIPYSLEDLRNDNDNQMQLDLFDIGGCACFVDYE